MEKDGQPCKSDQETASQPNPHLLPKRSIPSCSTKPRKSLPSSCIIIPLLQLLLPYQYHCPWLLPYQYSWPAGFQPLPSCYANKNHYSSVQEPGLLSCSPNPQLLLLPTITPPSCCLTSSLPSSHTCTPVLLPSCCAKNNNYSSLQELGLLLW